jgi:hypothetical protein
MAVILGGGHLVNVVLGQYNESSIGRRHETTFKVETYLCGRGSAAVTQNELYALEDDKATDSHAQAFLSLFGCSTQRNDC